MPKYYFSEQEIDSHLSISFLCGVKYRMKSANDKRNVLKTHIQSVDPTSHVIILEQSFDFQSSNKAILKYDDIFLTNLRDVETLTALYSDSVFIIHESNSTAAELGLFSTDDTIRKKLCLLIPDEYAIEEKKISNFIRLAFLRDNSDIVRIPFYPTVETWRVSEYKSDYRTAFVNNEIGVFTSKSIMDFICNRKQRKAQVKIQRGKYGNGTVDSNTISYTMRQENHADVQVPSMVFRTQIMALFNIREFQRELRKSKRLDQHVTFIENWYSDMMKNTIEKKEGQIVDDLKITIKGTNIKMRIALAYMIYLLQAMQCITLRQSKNDTNERIFEMGERLEKVVGQYESFIKVCQPSAFSRIMS